MGSLKKISVLFITILLLSACNLDRTKEVHVTPEMNGVISTFITEKYKSVYPPSDIYLEVHKVYGAEEKGEIISVYMYSLLSGFNKETKTAQQSGHTIPVLVKLKKDDGKYVVSDYTEPQNGSQFRGSIYDKFPEKYAEKVMDDSETVNELQVEIQEKADEWLRN